jgi:hypothetical protein
MGRMRWDQLFDDLEAQLEAEQRRDLVAEVADRTRRERAAIGLHERLMAHRGNVLDLRLLGGHAARGPVTDVGLDWLVVGERPGGAGLVPFAAIVSITGLTSRGETVPTIARRFGFGYALRGLSRNRAVVALADVAGAVTTGTIDAVGTDLLDLSEHPADLPRRPENVIARRAVPFSAVAAVRPG